MSTITRESPYSTAYDLYGDPHKLVEYRLFVLNECSMTCKGCFYNKLQNDFNDFTGALSLAKELVENDYQLDVLSATDGHLRQPGQLCPVRDS